MGGLPQSICSAAPGVIWVCFRTSVWNAVVAVPPYDATFRDGRHTFAASGGYGRRLMVVGVYRMPLGLLQRALSPWVTF